ncbi:hypothetical protein ACLESD_27610 [Pyxidicoccus sp. 3LFB2]
MKAPRWMCLLTALLALGGGSGCPGEPIPCINGAPAQRQGPSVFGVGTEAVFTVGADLTRACDEPNSVRHPESVTVEVKDPENQPVPATATLTGNGTTATIRFTPTVKGRHHVIVAFAPVGSLHQLSIFAGEDRRQEPALTTLPTGTPCLYLGRTTRGTWVCDAQARRGPDGAPQALGTTPGSGPTAVAGDVVWTVDGERVLRYVDTGTGPLQLTGTAPYPRDSTSAGSFSQGPHARLATPDELVVLGDAFLHRYTFTEAAGVDAAPTTGWVPEEAPLAFGGDLARGLLVRAGARLLVVTRTSDPRTFEPRTFACPYRPGNSGDYRPVQGEACHTLVGEPVGYEEGVVWTHTFISSGPTPVSLLRRYTATSGRLQEEGAFTLDGQFILNRPSLRPGPALPFLTPLSSSAPFVGPRWDATRGLLELELLPEHLGASAPQLGEHFLWMTGSFNGTGIRVYPRQSTR